MGLKKMLRRSSSSVQTQKMKHSTPDMSERTTCSSQTSSKAIALEALAQEKKYTEFIKFVETEWYGEPEALSTTPLHIVLTTGAPLSVIEQVISIMQELVPEESLDANGRTPLHIAANFGCSKEICERLLQGESMVMPALVKDADDRYPLHWACAVAYKKGGFLGKQICAQDAWNKRQLVTLLLEVDGRSAVICDKFGKSPLDYAKDNNLAHTIVRDLLKEARLSGMEERPVDVPATSGMLDELVVLRREDDLSTIGFQEMSAEAEGEELAEQKTMKRMEPPKYVAREFTMEVTPEPPRREEKPMYVSEDDDEIMC